MSKNLFSQEVSMQKRFVELLTAFLNEAGIECPVVPGENFVSIPLGDFTFYAGLLESRRSIVMQAVVGLLPSSGRDAFCTELLRMNSLFKGTQGATLGLEDDAVTLQCSILLDELSEAAFIAQATAYLEALVHMLEHFGNIAEQAQAAGSVISDFDILAMQNMIRI